MIAWWSRSGCRQLLADADAEPATVPADCAACSSQQARDTGSTLISNQLRHPAVDAGSVPHHMFCPRRA